MKKIGRLIYRHLKKNLFILGILLSITGVILGLFVPKVIGQFLDRHFLVDLLDHPIKLIGYLSLFILINILNCQIKLDFSSNSEKLGMVFDNSKTS